MFTARKILVEDGAPVKANQILLEWDPYTFSILTEVSGVVHFKDLIEGVTMQEQVDEITGMSQLVVVDSPDEKRHAGDHRSAATAARKRDEKSTSCRPMPT